MEERDKFADEAKKAFADCIEMDPVQIIYNEYKGYHDKHPGEDGKKRFPMNRNTIPKIRERILRLNDFEAGKHYQKSDRKALEKEIYRVISKLMKGRVDCRRLPHEVKDIIAGIKKYGRRIVVEAASHNIIAEDEDKENRTKEQVEFSKTFMSAYAEYDDARSDGILDDLVKSESPDLIELYWHIKKQYENFKVAKLTKIISKSPWLKDKGFIIKEKEPYDHVNSDDDTQTKEENEEIEIRNEKSKKAFFVLMEALYRYVKQNEKKRQIGTFEKAPQGSME